MRILHIGDYHYKHKANSYEQNLMVDKMIENLKNKPQIDLLLFTGDLVNSGSRYTDFEKAHENLISKLSKELRVPLANIFLSPGNHDIRREDALKAIISYFDEKVINSDNLHEEYSKKTDEFHLSLKPSKNYLTYLKKYYSANFEECNELYSISKKNIEGKSVAVISLNSAWLSSGHRDDINLLMFPTVVLKNALTKVKGADCKVLMLHHPLNYFKEFNYIEIEDIVHKEFDLIFSGHIHREQISTNYSGYNGIYANTAQAALTFDRKGEIGYSIVNYDLEQNGRIIIDRAHYLRKENSFIDLEPVHVQVPVGSEKAQQNNLRNKILSKFSNELNSANELLLDYNEENSANFIDVFTTPVLSRIVDANNISDENQALFNFELLYSEEKNFLIFGKDKSGKTTILKRLQLYFLKSYTTQGKVPYFIDYKELEIKGKEVNIAKLFKQYYGISNQESEKIIKTGKIVLLIDNLDVNFAVNQSVVSFLEENKNVQFIICSEYIASRVYFAEIDHLEYTKLYFRDLTRKEIRLYSERSNSVKEFNKEEVLEKITKMLQQLKLPVNYWTVSLILLIFKKSQNDYNKNLFAILDLCVDEILQKRYLTLAKSRLSFDQYKMICSEVAFHLLTKYNESVYSASAIEIINFIDTLIKSNERIVGDAKDIFDYIYTVGLLKEKNSKYTFRLNGIFEYFLAYYIHHNPKVKDEILDNDSIYLTFKNELEIYSGLNRKDDIFLNRIFSKTRNIFDKVINKYKEYGTNDEVLMFKLGQVHDFVEKVNKLKIPSSLSHEVQDLVKDEIDPLGATSEVQLKEFIDLNNITPEILEKYLEILARVFKNSDGITNTSLIHEIFDYLLEAYINYGFYLIDEYSKIPQTQDDLGISHDENGEISIGKDILRMLTTFIPILSQVMLHDGIGHTNISNIIAKHIEKYNTNFKQNQYKLFLLYFLYMDIDMKTSKNLIEKVFDEIKLSPLKVSTYLKLNFYLAFKAYKNKELESFLKAKIRESQLRIDSKSLETKSLDIRLRKKDEEKLLKIGKK